MRKSKRVLAFERLVVLVCFAAVVFLFSLPSKGQDHHPLHRDFYMHWKQPGTNVGCCQARINHGWGETGDCEPTKAEVRNGQWHAWLRQESRWLPIPDSKIIRERNPNVFDAHLCWTPHQGVLCFVPPDTGG